MPRRKSAVALDHSAADYGTAIARDGKGRFVPAARLGAGTSVELADIPDIDRPDKRGASVRVARRIDPLLAVLHIRKRERDDGHYYLAAEQFRRDVDISDGSVGEQERLGGVSGGGGAGGPSMAVIDARTRARRALEAMRGPENNSDIADVIRLVVVGWVPLDVLAKRRRYQSGTVRDLLDSGLKRLAVHYGLVVR